MSAWFPYWSDGAAEVRLTGLNSVLHPSSTSYWQHPLCQALSSMTNKDSAYLYISPYNLGDPAIIYVTSQTMETMDEKDREGAWGLWTEKDLISIWIRSGGQGRLSRGSDIGAEVQRVSRSHQEKRQVIHSLGRGKSKCRCPEGRGTLNWRERSTWKTGHCSLACHIQCNSPDFLEQVPMHHQVLGPLPISRGPMVDGRHALLCTSPHPQGLAQSGWEGPPDMRP